MKKIILLIAILISTASSKAQITYEHSYLTAQATFTEQFFLTNLGGDNYKYVVYTPDSSRFSLFNLDHSPFLLNIPIPLSISLSAPYWLGYITTSLFDCDSTTIEYAIMLNSPSDDLHPNFAVYRIDGTQLFAKDTVGTVFCVGCGSGSYEMQPIMNTPAGAKLYLFDYSIAGYTKYLIYSLCGEVPLGIKEIIPQGLFVNVFPNPTSHQINFQINTLSNLEEYELTIFNSAFQPINTTSFKGANSHVNLDDQTLSSGTYFYSLKSKNKIMQTGKFVFVK